MLSRGWTHFRRKAGSSRVSKPDAQELMLRYFEHSRPGPVGTMTGKLGATLAHQS
jgi:hypothetical protein